MSSQKAAMTARAAAVRTRLQEERPRHLSIEIGFQWLARDIKIAGGVLGGGLAYRCFFWALAFGLLVAGGLGFAQASGSEIDENAEDIGVGATMARTIATAAQQSETGRWWLVVLGSFFLLWFSWGLLRALRLVHAAAWGIELTPIRRPVRAVAFVIALPIAVFTMSALAGWVRAHAPSGLGLLATLAITAGFAAIWIFASMALPSRDVPWTAFIPGAILFAIGLQALHVFAVYYLSEKLAHQSELYGGLGVSATALFALFLVGRGIVWAAELNAVYDEVKLT